MPIRMLKIGTNQLVNVYEFKEENSITYALGYNPEEKWKWYKVDELQPLNAKEG